MTSSRQRVKAPYFFEHASPQGYKTRKVFVSLLRRDDKSLFKTEFPGEVESWVFSSFSAEWAMKSQEEATEEVLDRIAVVH